MGPAFSSVPFFGKGKRTGMKAVGIIAEYNPLHNGHIYHMKKARDLSGADTVVAAMSGNFVQRGMPAVFDKWTRTEHALLCGADLVIEIPVISCLGNAGQYAESGVRLLESLGCVPYISFGSESGKTEYLKAAADFIRENRKAMDALIAEAVTEGLSFPRARAKAYSLLGGPLGAIPDSPNDILALEYISAMRSSEPLAVTRKGAGYHDAYEDSGRYQSASALRDMMRSGLDISGAVPGCTADSSSDIPVLTAEGEARLFDLVRYAVMSRSPEWIDDCPSGGEGLGNLLKRSCRDACSLDELISTVKSKRYTYTRISRLCMQVLLGITRTVCDRKMSEPAYIRVLGFTGRGQQLLSEIKAGGFASLPVITNINKEADLTDDRGQKLLELDVYASDIYSLLTGRDMGRYSDHRQKPVIVREEKEKTANLCD